MKKEYEQCREILLNAVVSALEEGKQYIVNIERTARGDLPITGIALELAPWHGFVALSLRGQSDFPEGQSRYDSADWTHFNFTETFTSSALQKARSFTENLYRQPDESGRERAHIIFLAGAQALLDPKVAESLCCLDIKAPTLRDHFVSSFFQYIVVDPDETLKSNYCDLILANRITERLLRN